MGKDKPRGFWSDWETIHEGSPSAEVRRAWRRHLHDFLGHAPEEHWFFKGRRFKQGRWGPPDLVGFNPFVSMMLSPGSGLLPLYVLHLLTERPRYGNEIMKEIRSRTHKQWKGKPASVYPLLTMLEAQGLVIGEWEDEKKRTRRFYRITDAGRDELQRLKEVLRPGLVEAIAVLQEICADLYEEKGVPA